ncbi:hypothetical protein HUB97_07585 [Halorubraceae archaeon YAN]|nr:hypothetical protein [Halorubraceae archaeon YAN]
MSPEETRTPVTSRTPQLILRIPIGGLVLVSGALIGLGTLALLRGLHLYLNFYSYASGMATSRWFQTLFWSVVGGIVLSIGVFLLITSLSQDK